MRYEAHVRDAAFAVELGGGEPDLVVTVGGAAHAVRLAATLPPDHFLLLLDGEAIPVVLRWDGDTVVCEIGSEQHRVEVERRLPIASKARSAAGGERTAVASPMPGLLIAVGVAPGDEVAADQPVAILEAMKMQMEIRAPHAGRVEQVHAQPGQEVLGGQAIVSLSHA